MLDPAVLMRRAIRHVCEQHKVNVEDIVRLPMSVQNKFQDLAIAVRDDMETNQLKYFRPFQHQLKFFSTGTSDRRGILAANRIGKTVSTCYETAMHLTGIYPDW